MIYEFRELTPFQARRSLMERARVQIAKIDELLADAAHWNAAHPDERLIDADPYGQLASLRAALVKATGVEDQGQI